MTDVDKVREHRLRRMAQRQGLALRRSRRRDERALDYGVYWLWRPDTGRVVAGGERGVSLDQIEAWLTSPRSKAQ